MKIFTSLFLVIITGAVMAQIPNPSFETWTSGAPNNWQTSNTSLPGSVVQSSNAYAGSSAAQINSVSIGPYYTGGILYSGSSVGYFHITSNPVAVNGWYIFNAVGGDYLTLGAHTLCPNDSVDGTNGLLIHASTSVYKQFSICLVYLRSCSDDSANITFGILNSSGFTNSGTYAIVDDLSFGTCVTGIPAIEGNVEIEKPYPNPASDVCNIIYSIPVTSNVYVNLYDISGRKVMNILNDTRQTEGRYKIPVDVSSLANGVYFYQVVVNGQAYAQRLTVVKN